MQIRLILYGTSACDLCEQAERLIKASLQGEVYFLRKVDIANDNSLMHRYSLRIPVLEIEGEKNSLCWPFDRNQLMGFINSTHTKKPDGSVS